MDKSTLDCLNSQYCKLFEDCTGQLMVTISLKDLVEGNVTLATHILDSNMLQLIQQELPEQPMITCTKEIIELYSKVTEQERNDMYQHVKDYLDLVANSWTSANKSVSAVTGSLVGKVSKTHTALNEFVFNKVGTEKRDKILMELIKVNMPTIRYLWAQKQKQHGIKD